MQNLNFANSETSFWLTILLSINSISSHRFFQKLIQCGYNNANQTEYLLKANSKWVCGWDCFESNHITLFFFCTDNINNIKNNGVIIWVNSLQSHNCNCIWFPDTVAKLTMPTNLKVWTHMVLAWKWSNLIGITLHHCSDVGLQKIFHSQYFPNP